MNSNSKRISNKKINLKNKNLRLITEEAPFANEINWGDSFLGRLINSAMRKAKIGYNLTRVDSLVKAFKRELDCLVAAGLQRDTKDKFNELLLKSYLDKLRKICISNKTDEEKLIQLLGKIQKTIVRNPQTGQDEEIWTNQNGDLVWNNKKPNGGMWKDILSDGYLRHVFDDVDSNMNKEELKRIGPDKDKFLDSISVLIDEYRKLTSTVEDSTTTPARYSGFLAQFGNVAPKLALINASYNYVIEKSVIKFEQFITENTEINPKAENQYSEKDSKATENKPTGENSESQKKTKLLKDLSTKLKNIKKPDVNDKEYQKYVDLILSLTEQDITYIEGKNPGTKIKVDNKDLEIGKALRELQLKMKNEGEKKVEESLSNVLKFRKYRINEAVTEGSIEEIFERFRESVGNDSLFEISQREVDDATKLAGPDSGKIIIDLSKNPDPIIKIIRIFKRAHDLFFTPMIPSGRTGGKVSIKTYNEYVKLGGGSDSVSASSEGNSVSPGVGPFAVRKIYDKFRDGIMEVLEDQKYRKILSNVEFIVPGSEDTFNKAKKESRVIKIKDYVKIFEISDDRSKLGKETDSSGNKTKSSHGQILMDFIQDFLDGQSMADFDGSRRKLLAKYFDKFGIDSKIGEQPGSPLKPKKDKPSPEGAEDEDTIFWDNTTDSRAICTDSGTDDYKGKFYVIPIKKDDTRETIVMQTVREVEVEGKKTILVKFVFNDSTKFTDKLVAEGIGKKCSNEIKFDNLDTKHKGTYFGLLKEFPSRDSGSKFKIVYAKVISTDVTKEVKTDEFETEQKTDPANPCVRKELKVTKSGRGQTLNIKFEKPIGNERPNFKENLNELRIQNSNTKMFDALKDKAKDYFK